MKAGLMAIALSGSLLCQGAMAGQAEHQAAGNAASAPAQAPQVSGTRPHESKYVIGNDDVLSINVWKEPDLTQSLPVRSDGKISLPLIGELQATGRTPVQLELDITAKLRAFITQPDVTVIVQQMNSQKFNILGRVAKPGSYSLSATTTVLDAIAEAGGFQDFAKQKGIYILRPNAGGQESRIPFNYKDVVNGKHPEENIRLEPHDTIIVP
jgi:polysaccharide export outer membrane protein